MDPAVSVLSMGVSGGLIALAATLLVATALGSAIPEPGPPPQAAKPTLSAK
jgi:hypothetical protein